MRSVSANRRCARFLSRADFVLGIRHLKPDQDKRHKPSDAKPCKRESLAQVIGHGTPRRIAECGAEPDCEPAIPIPISKRPPRLVISATTNGSITGRPTPEPSDYDDGQKLRALKRYLQRKYALTPEQYRKKWGLPDDYPTVAPAYSEARAKIAKERASGSSSQSRYRRRDES
jgi:hypothetical protein